MEVILKVWEKLIKLRGWRTEQRIFKMNTEENVFKIFRRGLDINFCQFKVFYRQ